MSRLAATTSTVALVMLAAVPANAASRTVHDKVDDAPRTIDITNVRAVNGVERLMVIVHVRHLNKAPDKEFYVLVGVPEMNGWDSVYTWTTAGGSVHKHMYDDGEDGMEMACKGLRVAWRPAHDTIRFSVPQHCFEDTAKHWNVSVNSALEVGSYKYDHTKTFRVHRG